MFSNNIPFIDPNAQFMLPPIFSQNPFNFPHTGSHAPAIAIGIPLHVEMPIANNINYTNSIIDNSIQNTIINSTFNNNL